MKRNNRFTKRFLALFLVLCFVLGQINLPAGLIKISPDFSFLHTKAAGTTFDKELDVMNLLSGAKFQVTFHCEVISGSNITITGVDTSDINAVGNSYVTIPAKIDSYTVTALGAKPGATEATDAFRGCTTLSAISIPDTVTEIYPSTFSQDANLIAIVLSDKSKLSKIGASAFEGCFSASVASNYPDYIKECGNKLSLPETITSIGDNAFEGCRSLVQVTIADGAKVALGKQVFANLGALQEAVIPTTTVSMGDKCFYNCSRLEKFPNGIPNNENFTTIPTSAFENCANLKIDVIFSKYITTLGEACFSGCGTLASVNFSASKVTTIPKNAFKGAGFYGLPQFNEGLTSIEEGAFSGCLHLCVFKEKNEENNSETEVTYPLSFPTSLTKIGNRAFYSCTAIPNINWTSDDNKTTCNIQSLGTEAFSGCTNLSNFIVPQTKSLTAIPDGLLQGCTKIGRIMVPVNITSIGEKAFAGCTRFAEYFYYDGDASKTSNYDDGTGIYFQKSQLSSIGAMAFNNTSIKKFYIPSKVTRIEQQTFEQCSSLDEIKLHDKITIIGKNAFHDCKKLGESATDALTIPASVEAIGEAAFSGCESLKEIIFNCNQVTELPDSLLRGCTSLTSATLPDGVIVLPSSTFYGDSKLVSVKMKGFDRLTNINTACFSGCESFKGFNSETNGEITLPATLLGIGGSAFKGCKSIKKVNLQATQVGSIGGNTFENSGLTSIVFSKKLSSIGGDAFAGCKISSMEFTNVQKVPTIQTTSFQSLDGQTSYLDSNIKITVPANLQDEFKNKFKELGFTLENNQFSTTTVAASSLTITVNPTTLYVGQTADVTHKMLDGSEGFTLSSDDETVVRIIDTTKIEAVGLGETTIRAVTDSGKVSNNAVKVTVTASQGAAAFVKNPITSISLNPNKADLFVGDEQTIEAATLLGDNGDPSKEEDKIVWLLTSLDRPITKTNNSVSNGYVSITYSQRTGESATATIKVLEYTNKPITATCSSLCKSETIAINIMRSLDSITAKQESRSVEFSSTPVDVKGFFTFTPSTSPEPLQWSSNNPAVATVDETGKLTCVSPGQVAITVKGTKSGAEKTITLTVTNDITAAATADGQSSYEVIAGQSLSFTVKPSFKNQNMTSPDSLTWTSSNETIATISVTPNGTDYTIAVKTLKAGSASIIGKNVAGQRICSISIRANAARFEKTSFSLYTAGPNKKATIKPQGSDGKNLPANATISYAMADSKSGKIASVSSTGVITGKKKGTAKVTATIYGVPYTINVNVTEATLSFSVPGATANKKKTQYTISKKTKKFTLGYSVNYLGTTKKKVSFKSSKKSVATVSKKGVVKLKKKGTTKITITVNSVKKTFKLKVVK